MNSLNIQAVYQLIIAFAVSLGILVGVLYVFKAKNDRAVKKAEKDWENDPLKNR